jgi:hypothetical protein
MTQHRGDIQAPPILFEGEVARRMQLLAELRCALSAKGFESVLARNRRLVLRYNKSPCAPSGLTDPTLHILGADHVGVVTTNGTIYSLPGGQECPVANPAQAAQTITESWH